MSQGLCIYTIHFCLAVEAGYYNGVVEFWPVNQRPGFDSRLGQVKYFRSTTVEHYLPLRYSLCLRVCARERKGFQLCFPSKWI